MIVVTAASRRLLRSALYAIALVAALSVLAFLPFLGFLAYPLIPGIDLSGLIFSNGIESYHLLRFELGAIFINILLYAAVFYFIFTAPPGRRRRRYSEHYAGTHSVPSLQGPGADSPAQRDVQISEER